MLRKSLIVSVQSEVARDLEVYRGRVTTVFHGFAIVPEKGDQTAGLARVIVEQVPAVGCVRVRKTTDFEPRSSFKSRNEIHEGFSLSDPLSRHGCFERGSVARYRMA
jgi:hypothetical protein